VKLSLDQENKSDQQINALVGTRDARKGITLAKIAYVVHQEQLEEVSSMEDIVEVVAIGWAKNLLYVEITARHKAARSAGTVKGITLAFPQQFEESCRNAFPASVGGPDSGAPLEHSTPCSESSSCGDRLWHHSPNQTDAGAGAQGTIECPQDGNAADVRPHVAQTLRDVLKTIDRKSLVEACSRPKFPKPR